MAAQLVWFTATPPLLTCGHTASRHNGSPTPLTHAPPRRGDEWYCAQCALHVVAQLDLELAAAAEAARRRNEP